MSQNCSNTRNFHVDIADLRTLARAGRREIIRQRHRSKSDTPRPRNDNKNKGRRLWDEAVCAALGWDAEWMAGLRHLLHREPHVCGVGRGRLWMRSAPRCGKI